MWASEGKPWPDRTASLDFFKKIVILRHVMNQKSDTIAKTRKKVLVGMSGGVDSSVAAALLIDQGYDVTGGFMKNFSDTKDLWTGECEWRRDRRDAMRVAAKLGIPLLTFDFEEVYRHKVLDRMFEEYESGITPNPDVLCNEEIKFGLFFDEAMKLGFDYVATGHYARVACDENDCRLLKGTDPQKDQSYFLHRIPKKSLSHVLFPVGDRTKIDIRRLAKKLGLATADKPDSQGICFVGNLDMREFLRKKIASTPGDVVTPDGEVIGTHDGLDACTIGQRHGFQIASDGRPWYVAKKDRKHNRLVVVPSRDHEWLFSNEAAIVHAHFLTEPPEVGDFVDVAVRYRAPLSKAKVLKKDGDRLVLQLLEPVWAIAPGQSAVLYQGDVCLGGGFLAET